MNNDWNFDHQMYLRKIKCWYSNNCLHFLVCSSIWSITLESSITHWEASFTLTDDICITGHSGYDCKITIVICLYYRPPLISSGNLDILSWLSGTVLYHIIMCCKKIPKQWPITKAKILVVKPFFAQKLINVWVHEFFYSSLCRNIIFWSSTQNRVFALAPDILFHMTIDLMT